MRQRIVVATERAPRGRSLRCRPVLCEPVVCVMETGMASCEARLSQKAVVMEMAMKPYMSTSAVGNGSRFCARKARAADDASDHP